MIGILPEPLCDKLSTRKVNPKEIERIIKRYFRGQVEQLLREPDEDETRRLGIDFSIGGKKWRISDKEIEKFDAYFSFLSRSDDRYKFFQEVSRFLSDIRQERKSLRTLSRPRRRGAKRACSIDRTKEFTPMLKELAKYIDKCVNTACGKYDLRAVQMKDETFKIIGILIKSIFPRVNLSTERIKGRVRK